MPAKWVDEQPSWPATSSSPRGSSGKTGPASSMWYSVRNSRRSMVAGGMVAVATVLAFSYGSSPLRVNAASSSRSLRMPEELRSSPQELEQCVALRKQVAVQIAKDSWSHQLKENEEGILTHYMPVSREWFPVLLLRFLEPAANSKVFFDVGSHKGDMSKIYHDLFLTEWQNRVQAPAIYAFEPVEANYNKIKQRFAGLPGKDSMHVYHYAVSSRAGETVTMTGEGEDANLFSKDTGLQKEKRQEVLTTTVDTMMEELKLPHIDFLKVDVEGNELPVLRGAERALKAGSIDMIYLEYGFHWLRPAERHQANGEATLQKAASYLDQLGYDLFYITPSDLLPVTDWDPVFEMPIAFERNSHVLAMRRGFEHYTRIVRFWNRNVPVCGNGFIGTGKEHTESSLAL